MTMTRQELRDYLTKDALNRIEWWFAHHSEDQIAFYLGGKYDHDLASVLMAVSSAAQKGEGLSAEKCRSLDAIIDQCRRRAGLR